MPSAFAASVPGRKFAIARSHRASPRSAQSKIVSNCCAVRARAVRVAPSVVIERLSSSGVGLVLGDAANAVATVTMPVAACVNRFIIWLLSGRTLRITFSLPFWTASSRSFFEQPRLPRSRTGLLNEQNDRRYVGFVFRCYSDLLPHELLLIAPGRQAWRRCARTDARLPPRSGRHVVRLREWSLRRRARRRRFGFRRGTMACRAGCAVDECSVEVPKDQGQVS